MRSTKEKIQERIAHLADICVAADNLMQVMRRDPDTAEGAETVRRSVAIYYRERDALQIILKGKPNKEKEHDGRDGKSETDTGGQVS